MADVTTPSACCAPSEQASCCEPSDKAACCESRAAGEPCGCAAGQSSAIVRARKP